MDNLFTIEALATLAGASFLVYLVVAYTKSLIPPIIPTDLYAVGVAFVVILLAQFAMGLSPLNWIAWFLAVANAFLIAAQAGKLNDKAIAEYEKGKAPLKCPLIDDEEPCPADYEVPPSGVPPDLEGEEGIGNG